MTTKITRNNMRESKPVEITDIDKRGLHQNRRRLGNNTCAPRRDERSDGSARIGSRKTRRAEKRLAERQKNFEETCKALRISAEGEGLRAPGSMKMR